MQSNIGSSYNRVAIARLVTMLDADKGTLILRMQVRSSRALGRITIIINILWSIYYVKLLEDVER